MEKEEEQKEDDWTIKVDRTHDNIRHGVDKKKPRFFIRLQHLLHEVEKETLTSTFPVTESEKESAEEKAENLGVRKLEITDPNDPDIYALTFYTKGLCVKHSQVLPIFITFVK